MPRVPLFGPRQIQPERLPGARIRETGSPESYGAGLGNTALAIGARGLHEIRAERERQQELERDRMNEMIVLGARNQLDDYEGHALYGEQGAFSKKGKDAIGVYDQTMAEWNKRADMIAETLTTDEQRIAFERARASRTNSLGTQLRHHIASETERYDAGEYQGFIKNSVSGAVGAVATAKDDAAVAASIDIVNAKTTEAVAATRAYAKRNGLGKEATDQKVREVQTVIHGSVIEQLLTKDKVDAASAYLEGVEGQITGEALVDLKEKIDRASTSVHAEQMADTLWAEMGPGGNDKKAIELDKMEEEARKRLGNDVNTLEATRAALRRRKQAADDGRRERDSERLEAVWGAVTKDVPFDAIRRMPEFINSSAQVQDRIEATLTRRREHDAMLAERAANRANALSQRAYTEMMRQQNKLEITGFGEYARYSDPAVLRGMTRGEIYDLTDKIGNQNVERLLRKHEELQKPASFQSAQVNDTMFKSIAYDSGFQRIYETPSKKTPEEIASEGRLRVRVEDAVGAEEGKLGRKLTRPEVEQVMRDTLTKQVVQDTGWWSGSRTVPAASADPKVPSRVPLEEIRRSNQKGLDWMVNMLRSSSPTYATKSNDQIIKAAQDRIERAYAVKRLGGTPEEQMNTLLGKENK